MMQQGHVGTVVQVSVTVWCGGVGTPGPGALACTPGAVGGGGGAVVILAAGAEVGFMPGCTPGSASFVDGWCW
jgi:hypothetical protein